MLVRMVLIVAVILVAGFAPQPFPKHDSKVDLEKMQGEWISSGFKYVAETAWGWRAEKDDEVIVIVVGNRMTYNLPGQRKSEWIIRLKAEKTPCQIDFKEIHSGSEWLGIYCWNSESLTIAKYMSSKRRPTHFRLPRTVEELETFPIHTTLKRRK